MNTKNLYLHLWWIRGWRQGEEETGIALVSAQRGSH